MKKLDIINMIIEKFDYNKIHKELIMCPQGIKTNWILWKTMNFSKIKRNFFTVMWDSFASY